jgi:HAE1 family hydrophobic/amphiphilic exporter-1
MLGNTKVAQDISYEDMLRHQQKVVDIILKDPNIAAVDSIVGGGSGPNSTVNSGRITIRLKPRSQRRLSIDQINITLLKQIPIHSAESLSQLVRL